MLLFKMFFPFVLRHLWVSKSSYPNEEPKFVEDYHEEKLKDRSANPTFTEMQ